MELGSLLVAGAGAFALRRPPLHRGLALVVEHGAVVRARLLAPGARRLRVEVGKQEGFPLPGLELEEVWNCLLLLWNAMEFEVIFMLFFMVLSRFNIFLPWI